MSIQSHPILSRFLFWIVLPVALILIFVYGYLLQSLPQKEGVLSVKGLDASVSVIRDEHAVPHILASSDHDAFFSLGYVHAQDRMWQMHYKKILGQGRLSEFFGIEMLAMDQYMRGHGFARAAQSALESLDEPARQVLEAYAAGVNAWIEEGNILPVEFHILGIEPEPWKPQDSVLMIKLMALVLGPTFDQEVTFDLLVKEVGLDKASEILPNVNSKTNSAAEVNSGSLTSSELGESLLALNNQLEKQVNIGGKSIAGSNAWAVSGKHTKSGLPLLASDPHLLLEIPTIWYLAEIQGDRLHVTGATYPGVPIVLMGRNNSAAWGITNMMPDAIDLFVERTNPLNENQYEVDGQWVDMVIEEQLIKIRSPSPSFLTDPIPPVKWQIRRTRHGPLISDAIGRAERPLALRWTALDKEDKTFQSFLNMNYAENLASFQSALEEYSSPQVNIIYADAEDNIAHFAVGKIPIRTHSNGRLPVPGWDSKYDWDGYIPFEAMPHMVNPEKGYVVSANNKNHPEDYPYIISNWWSAPYRVNRINQVLESAINSDKKLEIKDFVALQGDTLSLQAKELLPFILSLDAKNRRQESAIAQLRNWDGVLSGESKAVSIYEVWLRHFNGLLLSDDLKGNLLHETRGDTLQSVVNQVKPKFVFGVVQKDKDIKHDWCDQITTTEHETCEELALIALDAAIDDLDRVIGFGEEWGDVYETYYPHQVFTNMSLLDMVFDRSISGESDRFCVNRSDWDYTEENGYRASNTAAYRQVVDFSDENLSGFISSTGQSGNIMSDHYDDNIRPFKEFKFRPMHVGTKRNSDEELVLKLEPMK